MQLSKSAVPKQVLSSVLNDAQLKHEIWTFRFDQEFGEIFEISYSKIPILIPCSIFRVKSILPYFKREIWTLKSDPGWIKNLTLYTFCIKNYWTSANTVFSFVNIENQFRMYYYDCKACKSSPPPCTTFKINYFTSRI